MALKLLLVAFTTNRMVQVPGTDEEVSKRVRFGARKVVDLTAEELELLDNLTKVTGKLHYRDPIQEGGQTVTASEPVVVEVPDYAGQDVAIGEKSVEQLKAYLTFHSVEFASNANKATLTAVALAHQAGDDTSNDAGDPDGGL